MDVLSALLPPTPPPMALTVNGRPLNDVLTVIANALRTQQEEIRQFKQQHQNDMHEVAKRFAELDVRVSRIEADLQIQRRPFAAYGQPAMATAYDAIATMEYRVHRSSTAVRANIQEDIGAHYAKGVLQRYWRKYYLYVTLRMAVRKMAAGSRALTLGEAYAGWQKGIAIIKEKRANERKVQSLLFVVNKRIADAYLRKFVTWHYDLNARLAEKRERDAKVANDLAAFNLRGAVRRYFNKWAQYQEHLRYNAERYRQAQRLEVAAHRTLAMNAYERWAEFTNYRLFEIRRQRAIATRHKQSLRALVMRYLVKWQRFVAIQQGRQAKYVLVTRMGHSAAMRLAHRYFDKILRFVAFMQQRKRTEELAAYLTLLAKKYDTLGEQLDLSLDNLSHTNGVLSRVVDTIILTNPDAPQVQSLLNIHRGDQTVNSRITTRYEVEEQLDVPRTTTRGVANARQHQLEVAKANGTISPAAAAAASTAMAAPLPSRHQDASLYPTAAHAHGMHGGNSQSVMTRSLAAAYRNASPHDGAAAAAYASAQQRSHSGGASSAAAFPHVHNRRQRMFSPTSSRENPEHRVMNVRELMAASTSPHRR